MAKEVARPLELQEEYMPPRISAGRRLMTLGRRQPLGVFGLFCIAVFLFCGIFADIIVPYHPLAFGEATGGVASLASPIEADATTIRIKDAQFSIPTTIQINDEKLAIKEIDLGHVGSPGPTEVVRGVEGTTADSHGPNTLWTDPDRGGLGGRLVLPIRAVDTSINLAGIDVPINVAIDDEKIALRVVTLDADNPSEFTVKVIRGDKGTEAVSHDAGAAIAVTRVIKFEGPSFSHPMGTDGLGRDVLSRVIFGARVSLLIGLVAVISGVSGGTLFGVIAGYFGGLIDSLIMRSVDVLLSFPALVLLLAIITVVGDDQSPVHEFLASFPILDRPEVIGIPNFLDVFVVSLVIGLAIGIFTVRVVRGSVLSLKENVYIDAARAMGASDSRIMARHILPNVIALVVVLASATLPIAILAEAALSFLGVGVPTPTPTWGADLSTNQQAALTGYWWPAFFPGLALSLVVLGFNMVGDAFRDVSDPRLRGQGLGGQSGQGGGGGGI